MKLFLFADLHVSYKQLDNIRRYLNENKDSLSAIIFAGDLVNTGEPADFARHFYKAMSESSLPFLWVPGNNDFGRAYYILSAKVKSLEGRIVELPLTANNEQPKTKFTGVGGSPASWSGQYAGEKMIDQKDIAGSIFVSHVPPPGVHNYRYDESKAENLPKKFTNSPKVHICAHIHHQQGIAYLGSTKIIKLAAAERGYYAILDTDSLEVKFSKFSK